MRTLAAIGLGAAMLMALGSAGAAPKRESGVSMPPGKIVEARRAGMMLSGAAFGSLRAQANAEDLKRAAFPARGLGAWAKAIPGMFPAGTNVPPTEALPAVWSDRNGFEAAAGELAAAADSAAQAAGANDKAAFAAAVERIGKACSGCHDKYRKPEERR